MARPASEERCSSLLFGVKLVKILSKESWMEICLNRRVEFFFFSLIVFSTINCVLSDSTIKANYNQPVNSLKVVNKINVNIIKSENLSEIFRNGSSLGGIKKNGYGWETASMYTDPKGPELIKNVIALELKNAGFGVSNSNSPNDVGIEIEVLKLFMEPEVGLLSVDLVTVTDANIIITMNKRKFNRRFKGIGIITALLSTDSVYEDSLNRSLQDFSKKAIPEIVKLIELESNKR